MARRNIDRSPAPSPAGPRVSSPVTPITTSTVFQAGTQASSPDVQRKATFLSKLYDHLDPPFSATPKGRHVRTQASRPPASAIRWSDAGDAILVPSMEQLKTSTLLPIYGHTNTETFVRQMCIYGFSRSRPMVKGEPSGMKFTHPTFNRWTSRRAILDVKRKASTKATRTVSSPYSAKPISTKSSQPSSAALTGSPVADIKSKPSRRRRTAGRVVTVNGPVKSSKREADGPKPESVVGRFGKCNPSSVKHQKQGRTSESSEADGGDESKVHHKPSVKIKPARDVASDKTPTRKMSKTKGLQVTTPPSPSTPKAPFKSVKKTSIKVPTPAEPVKETVIPAVILQDQEMSDVNSESTVGTPSLSNPVPFQPLSQQTVAFPALGQRRQTQPLGPRRPPPLTLGLAQRLPSATFDPSYPAGFPASTIYPARPRPAPVRGFSDDKIDQYRSLRRPSLPSLIALGLGGGRGASGGQRTTRLRSQSLVFNPSSRSSTPGPAVSPLAPSQVFYPAEPLDSHQSLPVGAPLHPSAPPPAYGRTVYTQASQFQTWNQIHQPPTSPFSSAASESSLRTPIGEPEVPLPMISESPPRHVSFSAPEGYKGDSLGLTGLESNLLGISLGGPPPQRSTVTYVHLPPPSGFGPHTPYHTRSFAHLPPPGQHSFVTAHSASHHSSLKRHQSTGNLPSLV